MAIALLALAAVLPCAGANDMVDALAAPLRVAPAAGEEALVRRHAIEPLDPSLDDEAIATLRAERAELMKTNMYHGTTTVAFRFDGGTMCCVDSRASLGNFVGSYATEKAIPVSRTTLGTMAGSAGDCTYWLRLLSATSKLAELETGAPPSARRNAEYLAGLLSRQPEGLDLSVGTMMFDGATLTYADNSGACLAGHLFAVGSGSPYAYSVLDAGYRADLSVDEAADLAEKAVRTAAARDAYSGGIVNVYFADKATGTWRRLRRLDDLP